MQTAQSYCPTQATAASPVATWLGFGSACAPNAPVSRLTWRESLSTSSTASLAMTTIHLTIALVGEVGQRVGCQPVDIAVAGREARPLSLRRHGHAGRHVLADDRAQRAPTALVLDAHTHAVADAPLGGVGWIELEVRRALFAH